MLSHPLERIKSIFQQKNEAPENDRVVLLEKIAKQYSKREAPPDYATLKAWTHEPALRQLSILAGLIARFNQIEQIGIPYLRPNQLQTLLKMIESYHHHNTRGTIAELATSEGKSSVIIPIFAVYLSLFADTVQVHTVNPYLVEELFQRIDQFTKNLFPNKRAQLCVSHIKTKETDCQDVAGQAKIIVGYWADFIHNYQRDPSSLSFEDPVILDEIDVVLRDEAATPAIVTQPVNIESFIKQLMVEFNHHSDNQAIGKLAEFTKMDRTDLASLFQLPQTDPGIAKSLENFIELHRKKTGKPPTRDQQLTFLTKNIPVIIFSHIIPKEQREIILNETNPIEQERLLREEYNKTNNDFWFAYPAVSQALAQAILMTRGTDYQIMTDSETNELVIRPLAHTGYAEMGKQFDVLTQLAIYSKEGLAWPKTVSADIPIDKFDTGAFYQLYQSLFGFTASVKTIKERLKQVFNLDTLSIPATHEIQRKEHIFFHPHHEQAIQVSLLEVEDALKQNKFSNIVLVTENTDEANKLVSALEQKHFEQTEIKLLTAENMADDREFYQWIGEKSGKRVLVMARMIGRGVDIKPSEALIVSGGLLLVSAYTPLTERGYQQLVGRVGRQGTPGEAHIHAAANDRVFLSLPKKERKQLDRILASASSNERKQAKLDKLLHAAWENQEWRLTDEALRVNLFNKPMNQLRLIIRQKKLELKMADNNPGRILSHTNPKLIEQFALFVALNPNVWSRFVYEAEKVFLISFNSQRSNTLTAWTENFTELMETYLQNYLQLKLEKLSREDVIAYRNGRIFQVSQIRYPYILGNFYPNYDAYEHQMRSFATEKRPKSFFKRQIKTGQIGLIFPPSLSLILKLYLRSSNLTDFG